MKSSPDIDAIPASVPDSELVQVVVSRSASTRPRLRALQELQRRRSKEAAALASTLLSDPGAPSILRQAAAGQLGSVVRKENQRELLALLESKQGSLLRSVLRALGRIGDKEALKRLQKLRLAKEHPAAAALAFARLLISRRFGLKRPYLRTPDTQQLLRLQRKLSENLKWNVVDAAAIQRFSENLERELPAIAVDRDSATEIRCSDARFWLLFSRQLTRARTLDRLLRQTAVLAVLMKESPHLARFHIEEYILTQPAKGRQIDVFGVRPDGTAVHFGQAEVKKQNLAFHLRSINTRFSFAVEIEGSFSLEERRVALNRARAATDFGSQQQRPLVPSKANFEMEPPHDTLQKT